MPALPRSQIGGHSGARCAARFFIDAQGMWVGEISGTLSIVKMADRRGSPSTPAPLEYPQKTPPKPYEEGCPGGAGWWELPEEGRAA